MFSEEEMKGLLDDDDAFEKMFFGLDQVIDMNKLDEELTRSKKDIDSLWVLLCLF